MVKTLFSIRTLLIILIILMLGNLAYLDFLAYKNSETIVVQKPITSQPPNEIQNNIQAINQMCPTACIAQIYEATVSSKKIPEGPTAAKATTGTSSQTKEFFVPFGSGSNATDDWEDVPGLKAYIDSTKYSSIKNVVFEASVRIPTGNEKAYVRLFNETDKHPVWFSDVSLEGGEAKLLVSSPIILDSGNKLYKVQMKTSLKFTAILDQARIHITTN